MSTFAARGGLVFSALRNVGAVDDARGVVIEGGTDGVVGAGTPRVLTSAGADFVTAGVLAGDEVKISTTYYTVVSVDSATQLTVGADMTPGSDITYSVVQETPPVDMTDCAESLVIARFNGASTGITVAVEAELEPDGVLRARIGEAQALTGDVSTGAAFVVKHGGCFLRARATALTGTDVDLIVKKVPLK